MTSVEEIVRDVRTRGDTALREWCLRLDGREPARARPSGEVPRAALEELAAAVRKWHELQRPADLDCEVSEGVRLERRWVPIASVGIYVPRGLISTFVMCSVPAQVAGVGRIVVATPPAGAGTVAAAAAALGIAEVWAVGGPPAIAALAYGTASIDPVDKIVGPGNAFVNEAKLIVARDVAIDLPAGPTEILVVIGEDGDRSVAEREIKTQAEHGPSSACHLIEVNGDLERTLSEIEEMAPEHLVLLGRDAESLAGRVRNVGAVFVGRDSPVAAGDYATGGNHVLPTGGRARSSGGLGLEAFLKPVTVQRITAEGLARLRPIVEAIATAEEMPEHARAVAR